MWKTEMYVVRLRKRAKSLRLLMDLWEMILSVLGIHQYPVRYTFNDKGESVADISKPGSKILYSGLFDNKTNTFRGIWHIEGKNNRG